MRACVRACGVTPCVRACVRSNYMRACVRACVRDQIFIYETITLLY